MSKSNTRKGMQDLEDAFIKVTFEEDTMDADPAAYAQISGVRDPLHDSWVDRASAPYNDPALLARKSLKELYPNHSIVSSADFSLDIVSFPGAVVQPLAPSDLVTSVYFVPFARRMGSIPGVLVDQIKFGSFRIAWDKYDFILYSVRYTQGYGDHLQHYVLHEGPEAPARALLVAVGAWKNELHNEIYVFNSGFWNKDHNLWVEVQKASWKDVILKESFKSALQKDVYGFFDSEDLYKGLQIPWKRGLIMYGPPGNGKTISLKAIMKECDAKGFVPLYVKSFKSWMGEEGSMAAVFNKAREMAPCVVVLEDLDSLINDQNRSFFLNQIDGLEGNDGLLVVATTNHFNKLDPALSGRPSRFDRKYIFDDPDFSERVQYVQYWQAKLHSNKSISFPDSLVSDIACTTDRFSFAYLKEVFVSSLVLLAGVDGDDKPTFASVVDGQIKTLREQLDKDKEQSIPGAYIPTPTPSAIPRPDSRTRRRWDIQLLGQERVWDVGEGLRMSMPGELPGLTRPRAEPRDARPVVTAHGRSFIV